MIEYDNNGDDMKKYILTVIVSLFVGFLLSNYMIKKYNGNTTILPMFKENQTAYLIQQGVYSSMESMKENTQGLTDYIYSTIDSMYYVYVGMTLENDNVTKLQEYYKNKGIPTIVKTTTLTDSEFIASLKQYDSVLKGTNDNETIKEVCKQVLEKYKGG